jgi:hypothetical protein
MEWYIDSVFSTADCAPDYCVYYGFNWSFASPHRPAELKTGLWNEDILNRGCLVAEGRTEQQKNILVKNAEKTKESFDSLSSWSGTNAQQAVESVKGLFNSFLTLKTTITPLQMPQGGKIMAMASNEPNNSAGVFKQIQIPINADDLQIDVRFRQVCPGDWLTVSIDGDIILYIDAATEGVSEEFKTFSAAVQKYAGKTVTLQITLESNGAEQTIADVDNLRFTELTMGADVNEDGRVDVLDLIAMSEYWMGPVYAKGDASDKADITRDGKIDLDDFAALSENWLWQKTGYIPGDINGDGSVDMEDLAIVSVYWMSSCDAQTRCQGADFEPDGDVDIDDLLFLAAHWLEGT